MIRGGLSIRRRIYGGFAVVLLLLAAELLVARRGLDRVQALRDELAEEVGPPAAAADALERTVLRRAIAVRNLVVTGEPRHRDEYGRSFDEARAQLERLRTFDLGPEGRAALDAVADAALAHQQETEAFLALLDGDARPEALAPAERRLAAARERLLGRLHGFTAVQRARQDAARARSTELQREVSQALVATALLVLAALAVTAAVTVRALRRPALALVRAAGAVEAGDYGPALAYAKRPAAAASGGELGHLARAFARMAEALRRREERLAADRRIAAALADTLEPRAAAEAALREIAAHVGASAGAVYAADGEALVRAAGVGAAAPDLLRADGLAGEALAIGRPVLLRELPADLPFAVDAGFGEVRPRAVVAAPLLARGERVGLLLLGTLGELDRDAIAAVESAAAQLAIGLQNALAHRRLGGLAAELRATNARLQAQNAELQSQAREIRARDEELRTRAAELRRHDRALAAAREALAARRGRAEPAPRREEGGPVRPAADGDAATGRATRPPQ